MSINAVVIRVASGSGGRQRHGVMHRHGVGDIYSGKCQVSDGIVHLRVANCVLRGQKEREGIKLVGSVARSGLRCSGGASRLLLGD